MTFPCVTRRTVHFYIEAQFLMRRVTTIGGRTYVQRCNKAAYETVAHALAETPRDGKGTTYVLIARKEGLPFTQVNIALEFMKECGLVSIVRRRCVPATSDTHLDAMVEFHALAHGKHAIHDSTFHPLRGKMV